MPVYFVKNLTGGLPGDLNALGIDKNNGPSGQTLDLLNDDVAIYADGSSVEAYWFDAAGTDAQSLPDIVRPNDFSTAGVWKRAVPSILSDKAFTIGSGEGSVRMRHQSTDNSFNITPYDGGSYDTAKDLLFDADTGQWAIGGAPTAGSNTILTEADENRYMNVNVDNYTALRAYSVASGIDTVFVRGYSSDNDGGSGIFEYASGAAPATYVDNDGTIIVPTGGDGSAAWLRQYGNKPVSARWFGARPGATGAANLASIQAAVDFAAVVVQTTSVSTVDIVASAVLLPAGVYDTVGTLRMKNGVTLIGASRASTVINHSGATDAIDTDTTTYKHSVCIKHLTILGDGTNSNYGVNLWGMIRSCILEDLLIDGFVDNYHIVSSWTLAVRYCQGQSASRYNVYGDGWTQGLLLGGRYDLAGSHSIYIENNTVNTEGLTIKSVAAQASQGAGIVCDGIKTVAIQDCFIEALTQNGSSTYSYVHCDMDGTGTVMIENCYINKGASGLDGKSSVFVDNVKDFGYHGNYTQSVAKGLIIGSSVEAGCVDNAIFSNVTKYENNSTGTISIKEGTSAAFHFGPDMNDGSFSYDKASSVFGDWNAGSPRYLAAGLWSSIPALQAGGSGTSFKMRLNPSAGNVEIAYNTGYDVYIGIPVNSSTLTSSDINVNDKGFYGIDCTSGNRTATITGTHVTGKEYKIAKRDTSANTLTITPSSGTIDGGASVVVSSAGLTLIISDGTNWFTK